MGTRALNRLSLARFAKERKPGRYCDGGGLYLQIGDDGARSWIFRFQLDRRVRDMGLGSAQFIGLPEARLYREQCRKLVALKMDPIEERARRSRQAAQDAASALTFRDCAEAVIEAKRPSWKSRKHGDQWASTLAKYAYPNIGSLPVGEITTDHVMKVLQAIWNTKNETAGRVRSRIEIVLDAAKARGARQGDNPARWRGHLDCLLAKPSKVKASKNHPALPYSEIASFMVLVRQQVGKAAHALEFTILTAARTNEVLGARWEEVDLERGVWTAPAERMKGGRSHRVPLSGPALSLLKGLAKAKVGPFIFPGARRGRPLSNMAMLKLLERMGRDDITVHGFRSTFRDWAAEMTTIPNEVAEMALAHAIPGKAEAAYRRGDLLERRANVMNAWAAFCGRSMQPAQVFSLRAAE